MSADQHPAASQRTCRCGRTHPRLGCRTCGPQPREQWVPCQLCARLTFNTAAICDPCADTVEHMEAQFAPPTRSMLCARCETATTFSTNRLCVWCHNKEQAKAELPFSCHPADPRCITGRNTCPIHGPTTS
jgi:hypothetical protein